jgi:mycothiol synthase
MFTESHIGEKFNGSFTFRPATIDDLESVHGLFTAYWEAMTGVVKFTLDDFRNIFSTPGFDLKTSLRVVESEQGQVIGGMLIIDLASPPVHPRAYGCVSPDYEKQGIGTFLINWAEQRSRQAIERVPDGARVSMYLQASDSHEPTRRLFEKLNLVPVRYSWFMITDLEEKPPEPKWPEGIRLSSYKEYPNLEVVHRAIDEAFQDHWGRVDAEDNEERLERFRHSVESNETFDPELFYLAMDGEEIAGAAYCSPRFGGDPEIGIVETLGVRRPWRRQGIALALLHHAFGEFYRRGHKHVGLGVDSQNLSGATRLYKKAGMHVAQEFTFYEKELRPGEELAKQG